MLLAALQSGCTSYKGCTGSVPPAGCYCYKSFNTKVPCSCTSCSCPGTSQGDGTGSVQLARAPGVSAVQVKVIGGCGTRWVSQGCGCFCLLLCAESLLEPQRNLRHRRIVLHGARLVACPCLSRCTCPR